MVEIRSWKTGEVLHTVDADNLVGADLSGRELADARLLETDLRNADMSGAKLKGADLRDADLSGACLRSADLSSAHVAGCNLRDADLTGCRLACVHYSPQTEWPDGFDLKAAATTRTIAWPTFCRDGGFPSEICGTIEIYHKDTCQVVQRLDVVQLGAADTDRPLAGVDLSGLDLRGARLRNLAGTNLTGACLADAHLTGADLTSANLSGASLVEANLLGAMLNDASFDGACMQGADLTRAELQGADFWGTDLTGAKLCGTNLVGSDFRRADLSGADLREARFSTAAIKVVPLEGEPVSARDFLGYLDARQEAARRGPNARTLQFEFQTANLQSAKLVGANLAGAVLRTVNLAGCDLREADLTGCDLRMALYDGETQWPEGFDPDARGAWGIATANSSEYAMQNIRALAEQFRQQDDPDAE